MPPCWESAAANSSAASPMTNSQRRSFHQNSSQRTGLRLALAIAATSHQNADDGD
jgi:hypothetical protein